MSFSCDKQIKNDHFEEFYVDHHTRAILIDKSESFDNLSRKCSIRQAVDMGVKFKNIYVINNCSLELASIRRKCHKEGIYIPHKNFIETDAWLMFKNPVLRRVIMKKQVIIDMDTCNHMPLPRHSLYHYRGLFLRQLYNNLKPKSSVILTVMLGSGRHTNNNFCKTWSDVQNKWILSLALCEEHSWWQYNEPITYRSGKNNQCEIGVFGFGRY